MSELVVNLKIQNDELIVELRRWSLMDRKWRVDSASSLSLEYIKRRLSTVDRKRFDLKK